VLSELFEKILRKSGKEKKAMLGKFFALYDMRDSFPVMRLMVPQLDKERQAYGMKEKNIAKVLVEHLGISKTSDDAQRLIHWKRPVVPQDSRRSSDKAPPKEIAYVVVSLGLLKGSVCFNYRSISFHY
jgi:DNA ligase-4